MVATSASEAELGAAYINTKIVACERITMEEIGHPQVVIKETPLEMDNSTVHGATHESIKKISKSIDMRCY